jgi:hypothetical protein
MKPGLFLTFSGLPIPRHGPPTTLEVTNCFMSAQRTNAPTRSSKSTVSQRSSKNRASQISSICMLVAGAVAPLALSHVTNLLARSYAPMWGDAIEDLSRPSWSTALLVSSMIAACVASGSTSNIVHRYASTDTLSFLSTIWLASAPILAHRVLFEKSLALGPKYGPAVFNGIVICPLLFFTALALLGSTVSVASFCRNKHLTLDEETLGKKGSPCIDLYVHLSTFRFLCLVAHATL